MARYKLEKYKTKNTDQTYPYEIMMNLGASLAQEIKQ
jgi:hypothetical protein